VKSREAPDVPERQRDAVSRERGRAIRKVAVLDEHLEAGVLEGQEAPATRASAVSGRSELHVEAERL